MNHKIPDHYARGVERGDWFVEEKVQRDTAMKEFIMMGLRLSEGIKAADFEDRFGVTLESRFRDAIVSNVKRGCLNWNGVMLTPTESGVLLNQDVVRSFF